MRLARQSRLRQMAEEMENPEQIPVTLEDQLATFLEALSESGIVGDACREAQLSRKTISKARKNPEFEKLYQHYLALGVEACEDEATRRATVGTLEPVFHRGRRIASIRKKSDLLLMFVLKARKPELYRDSYNAPPPEYGNDVLESPREKIDRRIAGIIERTKEK